MAITGNFETQNPAELSSLGFQHAADALLTSRAQLIIGPLGKLCIAPHPTANRDEDDITLVNRYFLPADESLTDRALKSFTKGVANVDEVVTEFDTSVAEHGLQDYEKLMIIAPHSTMFDILGINHVAMLSERLAKNRTARDNYMYLSRLLGYADYRLLPIIGRRHSIVNEHIRALANVVQVYPDTKTLASLRAAYPGEISSANRRANLALIRHQKENSDGFQKITFLAPSGSQMKKYRDGKRMEPISSDSYGIIEKALADGVPVMVAGFQMNVAKAYLPFYGPQQAHLVVDRVIMPGSVRDRGSLETFILQSLRSTARDVTGIPIYPHKSKARSAFFQI